MFGGSSQDENRYFIKNITKTVAYQPGTNVDKKRLLPGTPHVAVYSQSLQPNKALKTEIHPNATQIFLVVSGVGVASVNAFNLPLQAGSLVLVPPSTEHSIKAGAFGLEMLTFYAPSEHETFIK